MAAAGLALLCWSTTCAAIDGVSVEFAEGNRTRQIRVGVQRNWDQRWALYSGAHISGYWDWTLAYWRGDQYRDIPNDRQDIVDIGVTPVFRFERENRMGLYAEAGIGAHMLSAHYDNNGRKLSTNLQFATHLGTGYVLRSGLDIGLKIEHFSNAGIKRPNSGVNFVVLRVAYPF